MRHGLALLTSMLLVSNTCAEPIKVLLHLDQADQAVTLINVVEEITKANPNADVQVVVHGAAITRLRRDDILVRILNTFLRWALISVSAMCRWCGTK